jgi:hypothetical protein
MTRREVDLDNARTVNGRCVTADLGGQPDGHWARVFDEERLAVLRRENVDHIQIVLGNETIQIDVFDDGTLEDAKEIVREIVDRTNVRADDEIGAAQ